MAQSSTKATHRGLSPWGSHKWTLHSIMSSRGSRTLWGTSLGTTEKPLYLGLKLTFRHYNQACTKYQKGTKISTKAELNSPPGEVDSHTQIQEAKHFLSASSTFIHHPAESSGVATRSAHASGLEGTLQELTDACLGPCSDCETGSALTGKPVTSDSIARALIPKWRSLH